MVKAGDVVTVKGLKGAWVVTREVPSPSPHMKHWRIRQPMRKKVVADDMILTILPPMPLGIGQPVQVPGFVGAIVAAINDGQVRIEIPEYLMCPARPVLPSVPTPRSPSPRSPWRTTRV